MPVPMMVRLTLPTGVVVEVVTVNVELLPAFTVSGLKEAVTPEGRLPVLRVTVLL
jgi:hypothetical protein